MSKSLKKQKKMKGGVAGSAYAFGEQAYGGPTAQHAMPGSNQIAVNHLSNCMSGGKKKRSKKLKGGIGLTELALPAVLITANQLYKNNKNYSFKNKSYNNKSYNKYNKYNKSKRQRFSRFAR